MLQILLQKENLMRPFFIFRIVWLVHSFIGLIIILWGCGMTGNTYYYKYCDGDPLGMCIVSLFLFIITMALTILLWIKFRPEWHVWMFPGMCFSTAIFFGLICMFAGSSGTTRAAAEAVEKLMWRVDDAYDRGDIDYVSGALEDWPLGRDKYGDVDTSWESVSPWLFKRTTAVGDGFLGTFIIWFLMQIASTVLLEMGDTMLPAGSNPEGEEVPGPEELETVKEPPA
jgi:hypothetical protein